MCISLYKGAYYVFKTLGSTKIKGGIQYQNNEINKYQIKNPKDL